MEDYNTVHSHSRLGYRSPQEYVMLSQPRRVSGLMVNSSRLCVPRRPEHTVSRLGKNLLNLIA
jgi:hypothetical protein